MPPRPAEGSGEKPQCALTFNGLCCDRFNCEKRFQHTMARAGVQLGQYKPRQQPARPVRSTAVEAPKDTGTTDERMSKIEEMLVKLAQQHADTHAAINVTGMTVPHAWAIPMPIAPNITDSTPAAAHTMTVRQRRTQTVSAICCGTGTAVFFQRWLCEKL